MAKETTNYYKDSELICQLCVENLKAAMKLCELEGMSDAMFSIVMGKMRILQVHLQMNIAIQLSALYQGKAQGVSYIDGLDEYNKVLDDVYELFLVDSAKVAANLDVLEIAD